MKGSLQTTEMRMLRMICGKTLRDGICNQTICDMTSAEKIEEFIGEQRIRQFRLVEKLDDERVPLKAKKFWS